jgi:hypothetical protein
MSDDALKRIEQCLEETPHPWAGRYWAGSREDAASLPFADPVRALSDAVRMFESVLERIYPHDGMASAVDRELWMAPLVMATADALRVFEEGTSDPGFDRHGIGAIRSAAASLKALFETLVKRWGWEKVIGPGGLEFIAGRLEYGLGGYDRLHGRAVLTWRDASGGRCHPDVHDGADRAERKEWEPLPGRHRRKSERLTRWLRRRSVTSPVFGPRHPECSVDELDEWRRYRRVIEDRIPSGPETTDRAGARAPADAASVLTGTGAGTPPSSRVRPTTRGLTSTDRGRPRRPTKTAKSKKNGYP